MSNYDYNSDIFMQRKERIQTEQEAATKRARAEKEARETAHIMSCRKTGCTRCDPAYS